MTAIRSLRLEGKPSRLPFALMWAIAAPSHKLSLSTATKVASADDLWLIVDKGSAAILHATLLAADEPPCGRSPASLAFHPSNNRSTAGVPRPPSSCHQSRARTGGSAEPFALGTLHRPSSTCPVL